MKRTEKELTLKPMNPNDSEVSIRSLLLDPEQTYLVGRSSEAGWVISNPIVSRRHATLNHNAETWFLTDHGSRHGTTINGVMIGANEPTPVQVGDVISFGSWRCRCVSNSYAPTISTRFQDHMPSGSSISAIDRSELRGVAQRGLDALLLLTQSLESTTDTVGVSEHIVRAVRSATGCRRVVVAQQSTDSEVEILASTTDEPPKISHSLVQQAAEQGLVQLSGVEPTAQYAQSIVDLHIRSAICAPIRVQGSPVAFLMLDTRDTEGMLSNDAASFCQSVTQLAGLTLERINTKQLIERTRQLQADLEAARRAQELLSPACSGAFGRASYVFQCIPGRVVAGDLFDIFALDADRTAFFLGDVSGKGVGAAMLMAACQSQLRTRLLSGAPLADAMAHVNTDLHQRSESSKFVTLIAGIIDSGERTIELADAGHGLSVHVQGADAPMRIETEPGFPLSVVEIASYEVHKIRLRSGSSLVLFSDGAVEQTNPDGEQFGVEGVLACLTGELDRESLVKRLIDSVRAYAAGPLADDLTVAALWIE